MPYVVTPGNVAAGQRRHDGAWALGDQGIAVDGTNMRRWDIEQHLEADARHLLRSMATLRHSASGTYPASAVYIGSGNNHNANIPSYNTDRYVCSQYQVNVATGVARVAIAAGLYVKGCDQEKFTDINDLALYSQGLSSLLLGVFGWVYASTGLSTTIQSGYVDCTAFAPEWVHCVVPQSTDHFLVAVSRRGRGGFGYQDGQGEYNPQLLIQHYYHDGALQEAQAYANINVPWWYVMAIQKKFGFETEPRVKKTARVLPAAVGGGGRRLVYQFSQSTPWPDQHLAMSDLSYETGHWMYAVVPDNDAALATEEMF